MAKTRTNDVPGIEVHEFPQAGPAPADLGRPLNKKGRPMHPELRAMGRITRILEDLPTEAARRRVALYLADLFKPEG